jgi:hypothetical protein
MCGAYQAGAGKSASGVRGDVILVAVVVRLIKKALILAGRAKVGGGTAIRAGAKGW